MAYQNKNKGGKNKFKKAGSDSKMLQFGVTFLDETDGKADFKTRVLLYDENAKQQPCVKNSENEIEETFTREEAAELVAKALLLGRGISSYLFDNNDSWGGNARIDISGIELDESPAPAVASVSSTKRSYKKPVVVEEDEAEAEYDEELPY